MKFYEDQKERAVEIATGIIAAWAYFYPRICRFLIAWLIVLTALNWSPLFRDETDVNRWGSRSGFQVSVDAKTGCEYLLSSSGISPRMTTNGEQAGCKYIFDSNGVQQ